MNEDNVLDVLLYLFENYLEEEIEDRGPESPLRDELEAAGFPEAAVLHAFDWLEGLEAQRREPGELPATNVLRVYAAEEIRRLPADCRGFIMHMEQLAILPPTQRELVIERLMALDDDAITVDHVKWTVLMVLFDQPEFESAYAQLEDMLFDFQDEALH